MARFSQEAILIVVDVGPGVGSDIDSDGHSFMEKSKLCASMIIQRKIFADAKDELGLIIVGSKNTNNPLADGMNYEHIEIADTLQLPNWNMVHKIADYDKPSTTDGDWLDALVIAVDFMRTCTEFSNHEKDYEPVKYCWRGIADLTDDYIFVPGSLSLPWIVNINNKAVFIDLYKPKLMDWIRGANTKRGKKFTEKKIVFFTNFQSNVNDDQMNVIISSIKRLELQLIVIGPHVYTHLTQDGTAGDMEMKSGEKLIASIVSETDGMICSFQDALPQLMYFERKKARSVAWKANLDIGSNFQIPVNAYKKIDKTVKRPQTQKFAIPPRSGEEQTAALQRPTNQTTSHQTAALQTAPVSPQDDILPEGDEDNLVRVERDRIFTTTGDDPTPIDYADVIEGYKFGSTIVPVSDVDQQTLVYESGPSCLSVLGFTSTSNISRSYLVGDGCMYIVPENEDNSKRAFAALLQAMHNVEVVAIVRKVYRQNAKPCIGVLYPKIREKYQCMVYIELPYSEAKPSVVFPPIVNERNKPSHEQLEAIDQLIENMDLMTAVVGDDGEGTEAFRPKKCLDPSLQHFYHVVASKILSKNDSDVTHLNETVQALLLPPSTLIEKTRNNIKRIEELFPLLEVKPKEGKRVAAADIFKLDATPVNKTPDDGKGVGHVKSERFSISTTQPITDFLKMIAQGTSFEDACLQMQSVISDLVCYSFDAEDLSKPLEALVTLRKECLEKNPSIYNQSITKLKKDLPVGKKVFWQRVIEGHLGLISMSESKLSDVSSEEADKFLQDEDDKVEIQQAENDDGLDDLIGQM